MNIKKYQYSYNNERGYYLEPENYEIMNLLPKDNKKEGLIKVCMKNNIIYLFYSQKIEYKDSSKRSINNRIDIFEISDFTFDEIIKKFHIDSFLDDESKYYIINTIIKNDKNKFEFKNDYMPFLMLKILKKDACFEKRDFLTYEKKLNRLQKCIFEKFNEKIIEEFFKFLKNKTVGIQLKICLDEKELMEYLDDCKKDIYIQAKKIGLLNDIFVHFNDNECVELKRKLLLRFIEQADDKKIEFMYKASKKKLFILGL
jgi:hypothetical protein